ncbi:tetratricopeptide repeat protein [Leeuwenhoekiella palythoae]|uniref:Tetratricopeptide repeat protein n=1 Tax=Leeuwenhoekiella palythoae TaxID=573501 RepID=A0A1M5VG10_9FLAO|nr:tetratricopeptide repeat protein [Leeuwenhoekiella palythoae]RXG30901.1 tetratricopeptide repeat protein [Leeuwenhoekiella palythoae]SHH74160.1 Tetratricopeptide repeat-containing protein [Leeuwenhoekiella palythoae]
MLRIFFLALSLLGFLPLQAQEDLLARNYMQQGAYEKAALLYEGLVAKTPGNTNLVTSLVEAYQQLEQYDKAEKVLLETLELSKNLVYIKVDLAYNYQLQGLDAKAQQLYTEVIEQVRANPPLASMVGRTFKKYNLLDEAATTYTLAKDAGLNSVYINVELARIYGEQGNIEQMFDAYINLILESDRYQSLAQRAFNDFITDDPQNEANGIFRTLLLKRLQDDPNLLYNRLLSWLFIQQKEYSKAFIQEKAIARRTNDLNGIFTLASVAKENEAFELASTIYQYLVEQAPSDEMRLFAHQELLDLRVQKNDQADFASIEATYKSLLNQFGTAAETLDLQTKYAHFLAFNQNKKEEASAFLKETLNLKLNRFQEARVKMELADILVLEERFNAALIYYSQIQKNLKDNILAQEARFKVAKTSYYKGDFEWAKTQLKVLKSSAEQLIANDAQDLYLLITDNTVGDSTQTALKTFAKADLLLFQNKQDAALEVYNTLLAEHKDKAIEDETLLEQAKIFENKGLYDRAAQNYLLILERHGDDILADDAHYRLGNLYANQLDQPEKAKEQYEKIIFNFADSIFYVDAQQKYRKLRGDAIN